MNFFQKIAAKWYQTFDTGLLFDMIKNLPKTLRYIIYITFPLSLYFILSIIGNAINLQHSDFALEYPIFTVLLVIFGKIVFWVALFFSSLIFTYETALNLNLEKIKRERLAQKKYIKAKKLQWWRLRNMNLTKRIFVYIFFYFLLLQTTQILTMDAIMQTPNINLDEIRHQYKILLAQIFLIYIFIIMIIDYFANKKRGTR